MYEPAFLVVHVAFASAGGAGRPATLYTRWGDWFPAAMAVLLAGLAALAAVSVVRGNGARRAGRRR
jgi:apolipoprotein N-acyltransferase